MHRYSTAENQAAKFTLHIQVYIRKIVILWFCLSKVKKSLEEKAKQKMAIQESSVNSE